MAFQIATGAAFHEKIAAAGDAAFGAFVRAGAWSDERGTQGFIPKDMIAHFGGAKTWKRLVEARAGHEHGLAHLVEGGFQIHDFDVYNGPRSATASPLPTTAAESTEAPLVEVSRPSRRIGSNRPDVSAKRAAAGRAGALRRWQNRMANDGKNSKPDGKTDGKTDGKNSKPDGKTVDASGNHDLPSLSSSNIEKEKRNHGEEGEALPETARAMDGKNSKPDGKPDGKPGPMLASIRAPNEGRESDIDLIRRKAAGPPGGHARNFCRGLLDQFDRTGRVRMSPDQKAKLDEVRAEDEEMHATGAASQRYRATVAALGRTALAGIGARRAEPISEALPEPAVSPAERAALLFSAIGMPARSFLRGAA